MVLVITKVNSRSSTSLSHQCYRENLLCFHSLCCPQSVLQSPAHHVFSHSLQAIQGKNVSHQKAAHKLCPLSCKLTSKDTCVSPSPSFLGMWEVFLLKANPEESPTKNIHIQFMLPSQLLFYRCKLFLKQYSVIARSTSLPSTNVNHFSIFWNLDSVPVISLK